MKRLALVLVSFGIVSFILAPTATLNLIAAGVQFLGELARVVLPSIITLWGMTPEVLHPVWGVLLCGTVVLVWIGYSVISILGKLGGRDQ